MTAPTAAAEKPAGIWEDFVDVFYTPSTVFSRRRAGQFGLALLILTALSLVVYFATKGGMQAVMDAEFERQTAEALRKNPQIEPEQLQGMRSFSEKFAWIFILIGLPVRVFVVGLLLWVGGKMVGAVGPIGSAVMVSTYAMVPRLLEQLVAGVQGLLLDPGGITSRYSVSLSAARFLDPATTDSLLLKLAGQVDLFAIWTAVLLAIGLSVVGRVPLARAAIVAAVIWLCGAFFG